MTTHAYHPDVHDHGLYPGCPRCEEIARRPWIGLDSRNLARLRSGQLFTSLDHQAAEHLADYEAFTEGHLREAR